MELDEAMRTQHACRYYRDDPVPGELAFADRYGTQLSVSAGVR